METKTTSLSCEYLGKKIPFTDTDLFRDIIKSLRGIGKFRITFKNMVSIPICLRTTKQKSFSQIDVFLFVSSNGEIGYNLRRKGRSGFRFTQYIRPENILFIEHIIPERKSKVEKAALIQKKIHPNAWKDFQQISPEEIVEKLPDSDLIPIYIFPKLKKRIGTIRAEYVKTQLEEAFAEKKPFQYSIRTYHHSGRDWGFETKLCEDGDFRAWFKSEYKDCANGDYYLLLSPTVAVFYEKD